MSLRTKFMLALLLCSLASVALVGGVAYLRLMHKFDRLVLQDASRNFRADVAAYIGTYGSWQAAEAREPFRQFSDRRRRALGLPLANGLAHRDGPPPVGETASVPVPPEPRYAGLARPPFRFLLLDADGRSLQDLPPYHVGEVVSSADRERALPIEVGGRTVAYAAPQGVVNYSDLDLGYIAAMRDALLWGVLAAAALALVLGFAFGSGLSRSLQHLTAAIRAMQDGMLRQRVDDGGSDEVATLARAFNRMSEELAQSHAELSRSNAQIRAQAEQLRELSLRDALTELHNRRHFDEQADALYRLAERHGQPLTVMIGDIDFFKRINDGFSHAMGDAVLRRVAELLRLNTRNTDLVARYGGEEFVIAFPQTALDQAHHLCEQLRRTIEMHPWQELHPELKVTMSMGVFADLACGSVEAMLKQADALLYRAKAGGRNQVCVPA
jgi:diguanylate cyclase (GGDEF)-like protein